VYLLNRCFFELNEIVADVLHGCHLIYTDEFGEVWNSIACEELHNIIPGQVWALVRANLSFGF
jgi:S-adenosylmethionine hydrolase